uniref:SFRICE_007053 n=1 Tax=Spodoptera frugiperda TaxID=7108 RepID=A0A2H1W1P1_SPOFR
MYTAEATTFKLLVMYVCSTYAEVAVRVARRGPRASQRAIRLPQMGPSRADTDPELPLGPGVSAVSADCLASYGDSGRRRNAVIGLHLYAISILTDFTKKEAFTIIRT